MKYQSPFLLLILSLIIIGCEIEPKGANFVLTNLAPETILAPTPADSSMNNPFKIRLQWHGNDVDGRVVEYLYRLKGELYDDDSKETWYKTKYFFVEVKLRDGWYTLWVKAIDDKGAVDSTPDSVHFHVKGPTFDKGILLVDDDYLTDDDRDAEKDALYDNIMVKAGFPNYMHWDYETQFGLLESPVFTGQGIDLNGEPYNGISAYSTVIWYFGGVIKDDEARSKNIMKNSKLLTDYLEMGGNLWIAGMQPVFSIMGAQPSGSLFPESQFIRKFLRIRSALPAKMEVDKLISDQYPEYPDILTTYINPRNPDDRNFLGFTASDTVYCTNQIVPESDADVLYIFSDNVRTVNLKGRDHFVNSESFANTPCAIRYRGHYNVIVFGFPLVRSYKKGKRINIIDEDTMAQIVRQILQDEFGETAQ